MYVFCLYLFCTKNERHCNFTQIHFFLFRVWSKGCFHNQLAKETEGMEAQHEVLVPEVRPMVSASPTFPHSSPKSSGSRSESKLLGFVPSFLWGGHQNTDVEISSPSGFRHTSSISYNTAEGGFTLRNIPTEWKKLFKSTPSIVSFLTNNILRRCKNKKERNARPGDL